MAQRALRARLSAATVFAFASHAQASSWPASLMLDVTTCDPGTLDARALEHAIGAELETDGAIEISTDSAASPNAALLSIRVGCDATLTADVVLKSARTGRERQRSLGLSDVDPTARGRALALAISELVRSDWPELDQNASASSNENPAAARNSSKEAKPGEPKPAQNAAPSAEPARLTSAVPSPTGDVAPAAGPRSVHSPFNFALAAKTRWFVDYASVGFGAELGPDFDALRLRAETLFTNKQDSLGSAWLGSAALCVGYRVFDARYGALSLTGYPLAAVGATWATGTAQAPTIKSDPAIALYADLRLLLEARLSTSKHSPLLSLEIGRASGLLARAGERVLGATGGFFVGASAGGRY